MNLTIFLSLILQAASEPAELFLPISWIAILLAALSFFIMGTILGWRIWGAYRGKAKQIERESKSLLRKLEDRESNFQKYREKYARPEADEEPV